ncbi:MAG: hypothetical protein JWQ01_251, partial [Massilia sp.]|nr:hypothetical protein [Massilia sp.]
MKATAIIPKCKLGRNGADPSRHRPAVIHAPARRPAGASVRADDAAAAA